MRLHCTRYICGHPLLTNDMSIGLTKDGWPKKLMFLKEYADSGSVLKLKFVLTILNFSRSWTLSNKEWGTVEPNYSSIVDPPKGKYIIPSGFINKFVKQFHLKKPKPEFSKDTLYLSTKAGPDGPATVSAYHSLLTYNYDEMQCILNLTTTSGGDFFCKSYKHAWDHNLLPIKSKSNGKLSFVKDPEAKLRIIAISDYYTQLFLKPIHNIALDILKRNFKKCDRTFTQDPLHGWKFDTADSFWSLDLSSATDRFPIILQKRLLTRIFQDEKFSESWFLLLSLRKFEVPKGKQAADANKVIPDFVSYATGQPMGTYSSWAVFTLTHHLLVHYCAYLNKIDNFDQYIILGDDIVIKHDNVAKTYINVLTKMGVDVSLNKTHVSKDTYEFAKRWIRIQNGKPFEITGIPLKGIINNFKNPYTVFTVLYDYFKIKNNLYVSKYSLVEMVRRLFLKFPLTEYKKTKEGSKKNIRMLSLSVKGFKRIKALSLSLDIDFGYYSYDKLRSLFTTMVTNDHYPIPDERVALLEYKRILSSGMAGIVGKINNSVLNNPDLLINKFDVEDKNLLADNPVFLSICNTITRSWEIVKAWDLSDNVVLHNAAKEIHDLDIEAIFNKDRNKIRSLLLVGSMIRNGFNQLNATDEIWYGSSWTESTFTAPTDAVKSLQLNFNNSKLRSILDGKWQKLTADARDPVLFEEYRKSYENMWENFKL